MQRSNRDFFSNILRVFAGNAAASAIMFVSMPIVSRLYAPADFGQATYVIAIATVIASVASLRYDAAIVVADTPHTVRILFVISLMICGLVSLLVWAATPLMIYITARSAYRLDAYFLLLPLLVFVTGTSQILLFMFTRENKFASIAGFNAGSSFFQQAYRILAGVGGWADGVSYVSALVIGQVAAMVCSLKNIGALTKFVLAEKMAVRELTAGLKRYRNFPIFSSWSYLMNIFAFQLPVIMIAYFFEPEQVGYFSMAVMALSSAKIMANAIGRVLYQQAAEARQSGRLKDLTWTVYKNLIVYTAPPFLMVALYGRPLLRILFGVRWDPAGVYSQILALLYFTIFFTAALGTLYNVTERQKENSYFIVGRVALQACGLWLGGMSDHLILAVSAYALTGTIMRSASIFWIMSAVGIPVQKSLSLLVKSLFVASLPLVIWKAAAHIAEPIPEIEIAVAALTFGPYYYYFLRRERGHGLLRRFKMNA